MRRSWPLLGTSWKKRYRTWRRTSACTAMVSGRANELGKQLMTDSVAPPTALLWTYYFHALHLSHPSHPNPSHARSLELLEKANQHTPTLPEIYMAKARVLKRAGDPLGAAQMMEEARSLDGQDRFLNGKAAKYWLRAGEVKKATELLALFTKVSAEVTRSSMCKAYERRRTSRS